MLLVRKSVMKTVMGWLGWGKRGRNFVRSHGIMIAWL
jgi:hypothetical protein